MRIKGVVGEAVWVVLEDVRVVVKAGAVVENGGVTGEVELVVGKLSGEALWVV